MVTTGYSKAQVEKAEKLVARSDRWARGRRNSDGLAFIVFASQCEPGTVYQTQIEGKGCTCPAGKRDVRCYHALAAAIACERARAKAFAPKVRLEDLWPDDMESAF